MTWLRMFTTFGADFDGLMDFGGRGDNLLTSRYMGDYLATLYSTCRDI